jgi:hypothetical protein
MRSIFKTAGLALLLALGTTNMAGAEPSTGAGAQAAQPAAVAPARKKVLGHLKDHQKFPATRAELLAACKDLMDFTDGEKRWVADHLPEGTYQSADEVMKALWKK